MSSVRDIGEPLEREVISPHETPVVFDKRRNLLLKEDLDIVVKRANALRGCPDALAFVAAVQKVVWAQERARFFAYDGEQYRNIMNRALDKFSEDPALAWLREEKA